MGDLITAAGGILSGANRQAADAAHNIANMTTPGYRAQRSFSLMVPVAHGATPAQASTVVGHYVTATAGGLSETGRALDVALTGPGYFRLGVDNGIRYTRNGQFTVENGVLTGLGGHPVLDEAGASISLQASPVEIHGDGTVVQDGEVVARIGLTDFDMAAMQVDASGLYHVDETQLRSVEFPAIRQGFLETSNVSLGDEMVMLMEALRRAETGQRLVNTYDDLLGRVFSTLGQTP